MANCVHTLFCNFAGVKAILPFKIRSKVTSTLQHVQVFRYKNVKPGRSLKSHTTLCPRLTFHVLLPDPYCEISLH